MPTVSPTAASPLVPGRRTPLASRSDEAAPVLPDSMAYSLLLAARLIAAVHGGCSLTQALARLSKEPPAARAAAQDAAFGALRAYGRGEWILQRLLAKALPHAESQALLMAALFRLQSRPDAPHTVVDQAVVAAGELAGGRYRGLVNGVLRNYLRQQDALHQAMAVDEEAWHQHPRWWLRRLRAAYPDGWQAIVATDNRPAPMTLRVNLRRTNLAAYASRLQASGFTSRPLGRAALLLPQAMPVSLLPGFSDGEVSIQDAGAQRAVELLAPVAGERVLDGCAAPGGKTAHLLEAADVDLLALDIDATRSQRIEENLRRLGLQATIRVADCRAVEEWWDGRPFDAILADVPCSASGVVRRHPDIKYLRRESDLRPLVRLQAELLDRLWPLVRPGGRLLYVTCSVFPEESQGQIDSFLFRQPTARVRAVERLLPTDDHDGFYHALLQKSP